MLEKQLFKKHLGTWYETIEPLFDNGIMDDIYRFLKFESDRGKIIAPVSDKTYRCFTETPINNVKVVMLGLCPYHTVIENKQVADGILMSCGNHNKYIAPSLKQFYGALEEEFHKGLCLPCYQGGDLTYLSNQGVLMLNAALTTEIGKAKAHQDVWKPFTEFLFEEILGKWDIPVVFLGKEAAEFEKHLAPMQWSFKLQHPAFAERQNDKWHSHGTFTKINKILTDLSKEPIKWLIEEAPF